jgi:sugar O-acyltransferase (sialic acid O-acetyltransferase NeuD family)
MLGKLIIIGGGEHARVAMEAAILLPERWKLIGYIDVKDDKLTEKIFDISRLGDDSSLKNILAANPGCRFVCGIGDNDMRRKIVLSFDELDKKNWATIVHPDAYLSPSAKVGPGSVIFSRAVVQTGAIVGMHCIINSGGIVEHDSSIGDFSHIAPAAVMGGTVKVGTGCLVGLGSRIRDHINIGDNVTIGSGSVVVTDIADGETAVGVPARRIGSSRAGRDLHEFCVSPDASIFEAMSIIGKSGTTAVLVTDPDLKVLGLLTDGDIRRAMMDNTNLNKAVSTIMNRKFRHVNQNLTRVSALDQMNALGIAHMPVLDDHGRLVGVHLLSEMIGSMRLPNIALVMAGGKGVRLKPITDKIPKPMVKVAGRPILEHIIFHLANCNIRKIYIAVNYLGEMIEQYFKDGSTYGVEIHYLRETSPLGTAGALRLLPEAKDNHPIICMNGDLVTQFDVERMLNHHSQGGYDMTIGVHDHRVEIPYGVIEWDDRKEEVLGIREKPEEHFIVNGGIYAINPNLIKLIEPGKEVPMTDLIEKCLENRIRVGVHLVEGDWIDVGQHKELATARGM